MPESETEQSAWQAGFILSQGWMDLPAGCLLTFWGRSEAGPFELRVAARPVMFISRAAVLPDEVVPVERRSLDLHDFSGTPVDVLYFRHAREQRAARESCIRAHLAVFEGDLDPASRYLMERFVFGSCEFAGEGSLHDGVTVYHNPRIRAGAWRPQLSRLAFDIETGSAGELYAVSLHFVETTRSLRRVYLLGHGRARHEPPVTFCADEADLLQRFLADVQTLDPDLLAGWNILGYDLPFLAEKARALGLPLALGRRRLEARIVERNHAWYAEIPGRIVADGIPLLRATHAHFENFRLETVARDLLGEGKELSFDGLDKQLEIDRLFREDRLRLAAYNLHDSELVNAIFERTGLVDLMIGRSLISGLPPDRLGQSIAAFDYFFLPRLHRKGRVAPDRAEVPESGELLSGGLVLTPRPGVHEHVVVLDFKSLYPSVIRTFSICPYAQIMASQDPVTTPTGHAFSSSARILPEVIAELMARRAQARQAGDAALAQAVKLLMNSLYGVLGAPHSRFFNPDIAQAITGTGQWILRTTRDHLESCGHTVLYGDTDSVFVRLSDADARHPHRAGQSLAAAVNAFFATELRDRFGVTSVLEIVFERYYRRFYLPLARHARSGHATDDEPDEANGGIPPEGAAKRYAGLVVDAQGGETLQVTGMESVRSDWTALAHRLQREALLRFFHNEPLPPWLRAQVAALRAGTCDDELVYHRRLRKAPSTYTRALPPHVRAARLLPPEAQRKLGSIDYVMTLRGPVPTPLPHGDVDYAHYVEKQIRPVVEDLLSLAGHAFDGALSGEQQLELF